MEQSSDKGAHSFTAAATTTNNNDNNQSHQTNHLKNLNKTSHKISKPITKKPSFDHHPFLNTEQQSQPPVYTINKNDFRDVVQKLTGSPAHHHPLSTHPKPTTSRLQRIRPPPLAHVSARPSPPLTDAAAAAAKPFSPLPPFPSVSAAAESPITAYMKYVQTSYPTAPRSPCALFSPSATALLGLYPMLPMSPSLPVPPSSGWRDL